MMSSRKRLVLECLESDILDEMHALSFSIEKKLFTKKIIKEHICQTNQFLHNAMMPQRPSMHVL